MSGVNREQIESAKKVDILDYILKYEPDNIRRIGNAHYLKDHESFEISNGLWNWHSHGIGGKNVVDYLIKIRGFSFVDAVSHLTGDKVTHTYVTPNTRPPPERNPFTLPPRNKDNNQVIAYLQNRGIDKQLISDCIRRGSLYESAQWHNAVFVGRDENGKARYASLRGTTGDFKRDAYGSDKRFGFLLPPKDKNSDTVATFESAVDALSHQSLCPDFDGWRLSLGSTALIALTNFLELHKNVISVLACTDNDDAGNCVAKKMAKLPIIQTIRILPHAGKDWNDALLLKRNEVNIMQDVRKDIKFITPDYDTKFTIKDGDSIKFTSGYDGEIKSLKCRYIDEAHLQVIGQYHNDYHICEFAEINQKAGNKYEPITNQSAKIDVLTAKYGEPLKDVSIPISEAEIRKLVGGGYDMEHLCNAGKDHIFGALLRGKAGIVVCGVGGDENKTPTSLHPFWAQKYKREISTAEPPKKPSLLGGLEKAKEDAAAHNAAQSAVSMTGKRGNLEIA